LRGRLGDIALRKTGKSKTCKKQDWCNGLVHK
jgi:hypothetical protein